MLFSDEYFLLDRVCLVQYHKRIYLPKYNLVNKNRYYRKQKRLELREDFRITPGRGTQHEGRRGHRTASQVPLTVTEAGAAMTASP